MTETFNAETLNAVPRPAASLHLESLQIENANGVLLQPTDLTIPGGKIAAIVGASGVGKSVLLRTLAGLIPRDDGSIRWQGQVRSSGGRIGVVFQQFALFDELSALENVQFAIDHRSDRTRPPAMSAKQWLGELGVPSQTPVSVLSGGQKQRLAIARTLAAGPDVILYDEPTSGLDAATGKKVADLIAATHVKFGRTSVIVTHDYETMLAISDDVFLLDSISREIRRIDQDQWTKVPTLIQAVSPQAVPLGSDRNPPASQRWLLRRAESLMDASGRVIAAVFTLLWDLRPSFPSPRWAFRFFLHYLRLVGGPSASVYLIMTGLIAGFTTTYFTFRFLPFRLYTQPLLIDELLASIGFALYRVLVPVLATVLIAARCGAAVAADVAVKQYNGGVDAMRTFGIAPRHYLLIPVVAAFVVATPWLEWLAFESARLTSAITFGVTHDEVGDFFWRQHFDRTRTGGQSLGWRWFQAEGFGWVLAKNLLCGVGTGVIGYHRGLTPKRSASDVSDAITSTVLWSTLWVLVVHFVIALLEF